jgi:hypothetical protein
LSDNEHLRLATADGQIWRDIGLGAAPFWLDNTHYGYAEVSGNLAQEPAQLVITAVADSSQSEIQLAELAQALPPLIRLRHLTLRAVVAAPHDPDLLFITANVRRRQSNLRSLLFTYQRQSGRVSLIYASPYTLGFYKPITFSPDGNWLTVTTFDHNSTLSDLFLYHIPSSQGQSLGSNHLFSALEYDWSADSRWLLRLENGFLHLIEPATGRQKVFVHELSGCSFAAWVNQ